MEPCSTKGKNPLSSRVIKLQYAAVEEQQILCILFFNLMPLLD